MGIGARLTRRRALRSRPGSAAVGIGAETGFTDPDFGRGRRSGAAASGQALVGAVLARLKTS